MGSEEKQEMDGGKARSIEPKESAQSPINSRQEIKDNYVVIDTNILFRIITQGVPGCEHKYWDKIQDFTKNKKITLIVPEVVLLEFE